MTVLKPIIEKDHIATPKLVTDAIEMDGTTVTAISDEVDGDGTDLVNRTGIELMMEDFSSGGSVEVWYNNAEDIGEDLADIDQLVVGNTSGSSINKSSISRIWSYITSKFESETVSINNLTTSNIEMDGTTVTSISDEADGDGTDLVNRTGIELMIADVASGGAEPWDGDISDIAISGGTDIGEDLTDNDLIVVGNTSGSSINKSSLSRIWSYISSKLDSASWSVDFSNLLISAQEITEDPIDTDIIIADYGDNGSYGKLTFQRVYNYVVSKLSAAGGALLGNVEIKDYSETTYVASSSSGTLDIDLENGNVQSVTQTEDITTFTFSNWPTAGKAGSLTLILDIDTYAQVWPNSIIWSGGEAPDLCGINVLTFFTIDGGTTVYGFMCGYDFSPAS